MARSADQDAARVVAYCESWPAIENQMCGDRSGAGLGDRRVQLDDTATFVGMPVVKAVGLDHLLQCALVRGAVVLLVEETD